MFNRRNLVLMNSLCLDLTYDRLVSHKELAAGGTRFEQALTSTGLLPLGAADLHRMHPTLWRTEKAAKHDLERAGITTPIPQIEAYLRFGGIYRYRRKGQRGLPSRALIDPARHPDPRAALEAAVGPLALFQALGDLPAVPPAAPASEPLPEPAPAPVPAPPDDSLDPPFWPPWPAADNESRVAGAPAGCRPSPPARAWVPQ